VRAWLEQAPWWALSLVTGLFFGGWMTLAGRFLQGESWGVAVVGGVFGGVLFGAVVGPLLARQRRRAREAAGTDRPDLLRRAARVAARGPVPEDPELREAARRLALHQRAVLLRQRRWALPFLALVLAGDVAFALTRSPAWVWWLGAVFFAALLSVHLLWPRRLARRARLLATPEDDAAAR
jgi:membrane associated rhomboid family serine protease